MGIATQNFSAMKAGLQARFRPQHCKSPSTPKPPQNMARSRSVSATTPSLLVCVRGSLSPGFFRPGRDPGTHPSLL